MNNKIALEEHCDSEGVAVGRDELRIKKRSAGIKDCGALGDIVERRKAARRALLIASGAL
jgi:hypothetical protein